MRQTWPMSAGDRLKHTMARLTTNPRVQPIMRKVVPRLDRVASRLTKGRLVLTDAIVPTLILHHVGRKSGQARSTPLAYVGDGDQYLVIGSNWGQAHHPAWALNISDRPDVEIEVKGRRIPAVAHRLEGDERDAAWNKACAMWPSFDTYEVTADGRNIRVFALRPTG